MRGDSAPSPIFFSSVTPERFALKTWNLKTFPRMKLQMWCLKFNTIGPSRAVSQPGEEGITSRSPGIHKCKFHAYYVSFSTAIASDEWGWGNVMWGNLHSLFYETDWCICHQRRTQVRDLGGISTSKSGGWPPNLLSWIRLLCYGSIDGLLIS